MPIQNNILLTTQLKDFIEKEGVEIDEIDPERNYWFIRTQGGSYFDEFYFGDFVAIGWDDVPCLAESDRTDAVFEKLKDAKYGQPSRVMNQVYRFCTGLKKGDIVIIPSESSAAFAFGIIDSDVYMVTPSQEDIDTGKCLYTRRRKVKWTTGVPRNRVDSKLYSFFRNQQALSSANDHAEFIDRALSPFYIKNDVAHFTLSVNIQKSPRASDIPTYMHGILVRADHLAKKLGLILDNTETEETESDEEHIKARINVQSDGIIELLGNPVFVFLVSIVVIALFGGNLRFKYDKSTFDGQVGTEGLPGLIKTISDVLSAHKSDAYIGDKEMKKIQERLQIDDPKEK